METISKKICLLGHFNSGKTSLVLRFIEQKFNTSYEASIGAKIFEKTYKIADNRHLNLCIWDIAGSLKSYFPNSVYLQGTDGVILVTDISQPEGLDHVKQYLNWLETATSFPLKIAIALNKCDLLETADLPIAELQEKPSIVKVLQTSAKTGKNIDIIFQELLNQVSAKNS